MNISPKKRLAIWTEAYPEQHARIFRTPTIVLQFKRQTPETKRRNVEYLKLMRPWLRRPENRLCQVWLRSESYRAEVMEHYPSYCWPDLQLATQCHHRRGRRKTKQGDLLLLQSEWVPVSAAGHEWISRNMDEARRLGLLAPLGQYDTWPIEHK